MIFDLNSGAPEFNGAHYDPDADPFFFRQLSPTTYWGFSEKGGDRKKAGGKTQKGPEGVTLFAELQDAFIGVVEHVRNPPRGLLLMLRDDGYIENTARPQHSRS